jgi:hypothetical protein
VKLHSSHDSKQKSGRLSSKIADELQSLVESPLGTSRQSEKKSDSFSFAVPTGRGVDNDADRFADSMKMRILQKQRQKTGMKFPCLNSFTTD